MAKLRLDFAKCVYWR